MADNILLKNTKKEKDFIDIILEIGLFPSIGRVFSTITGWIVKGLWAFITFLFGPQNRQETSGNDSLYLKATIISVILSLFLAGISFYGSYTAARMYALNHGIAANVAGWIPVAVDGFILLGVLVVFGASLVGERVGWVRFLIFVFAVVSVIFNVAHITEKAETTPQHILLGAIFPLIVFLASEVTSKQISAYIERKSSLMTNQTLAQEIEARIKEKQGLIFEIKEKRRAMLAEAQANIKAELEGLESRRNNLQSEIEQGERKLKRLQDEIENTINFDEIDLQIAFLLGNDPAISGAKVGQFFDGKSSTWGNTRKNRVYDLLNGVKEYVG